MCATKYGRQSVSLLDLPGIPAQQGQPGREHSRGAESQDEANEERHHGRRGHRDDDVEHVGRALQLAGVVQVHAEYAADVGAQAEAAREDGQAGVGVQQLVAGRVQPQRQLQKYSETSR